MIDIKDIEAFLAILDEGSISKAAEKLGITQPALSLKLKKMEADLGVPLFQRTPRAMIPLETCMVIEAPARDIVTKLESVRERLAERISEVKGIVRVGCLTGWVNTLTLPLVMVSRKETPHIQIKIEAGQTGELLRSLSLGQLDLAIVARPFEPAEGLTCKHLLDERLVLIGNNLPTHTDPESFRKAVLKMQWITLSSTDNLVNRYWQKTFAEEFPWDTISSPITLDHIYSIRTFVENLQDTVAVLPSQVVMLDQGREPSFQIHHAASQSNGVFLVWRENGLELRRFKIVQEQLITIALRAAELLQSGNNPRA
jgi:DNA-binding transcriptional LysR family regulator